MQNKSNYTAKDISVLDGIEGIRQRTGMYIGSTDADGVKHCVLEIISNSIDESLNGYGNEISIFVDTKTNMVTVSDFGRGIPFDKMSDGQNAIVSIFTNIHAGGKFGQGNYGTSGGLNGVGGTAVNAVSETMIIKSYRDDKMSEVHFSKGRLILETIKENQEKRKNGSIVSFILDKDIFINPTIPLESLRNQIELLSFLTKDVKFNFTVDNKTETFLSKEGIKDLVKAKSKDAITDIYYMQKEIDIYNIEIALQYTKSISEKFYTFTNNIPNNQGGTHLTGFRTALTQTINKLGKQHEMIDTNLEGELIRKGVLVAISVKMKATPQFAGQTKEKLTTPEVKGKVQSVMTEMFGALITKKDLETIIDKILKEKKAEDAAERQRQAEREIVSGLGKKARMKDNLPSKLVEANGKEYRELFLVEGDSAETQLVKCRNPKEQAVLALRGKVLNTYSKELADILHNKEIKDILTVLGAGAGGAVNLKQLRYDKVILAMDADAK